MSDEGLPTPDNALPPTHDEVPPPQGESKTAKRISLGAVLLLLMVAGRVWKHIDRAAERDREELVQLWCDAQELAWETKDTAVHLVAIDECLDRLKDPEPLQRAAAVVWLIHWGPDGERLNPATRAAIQEALANDPELGGSLRRILKRDFRYGPVDFEIPIASALQAMGPRGKRALSVIEDQLGIYDSVEEDLRAERKTEEVLSPGMLETREALRAAKRAIEGQPGDDPLPWFVD